MTEQEHASDSIITATVLRERLKLLGFIKRNVRDQTDAEDILQDVFHEFVEAYRLPEPIEQVTAWLYRVARNRIIDRFRKKKEVSVNETAADFNDGDDDSEYRLDLVLPSAEDGPEAQYARHLLLCALEQALSDLPEEQREVFMAHEIEGISFKEMASLSGIPVNTLLARKRYAVLQLRSQLQAVYDELDI
jgi:RNA polymerase sigma factor (sigma-70 family)